MLCLALFSSIHEDYPFEQTGPQAEIENTTILEEPSDAYNPALFDLEIMAQDFVLQTKQIELPEYPGAFNPSIIRWQDSILLSFRIRDPITKGTDGIGLIWLDEDFNPKGTPQVLSIFYKEKKPISKQQDPRLIQIGESLFLVYNNVIDPINHPELRRMHYVELFYDGNRFHPKIPQVITQYPNQLLHRQEKNWTPFQYCNELFLIYTILPHTIFYPRKETPVCELYTETTQDLFWPWGVLRGGTPALKIEDQYLSFFHSSTHLPSLHSEGKKMLHYFMGAYTFSAEPPFQITQISPHPIIGKTFYTGPAYKTWKPLRVVFPGGFIYDQTSIWIVYGKQDFEMWVVQLDRKKFFESLIPVDK